MTDDLVAGLRRLDAAEYPGGRGRLDPALVVRAGRRRKRTRRMGVAMAASALLITLAIHPQLTSIGPATMLPTMSVHQEPRTFGEAAVATLGSDLLAVNRFDASNPVAFTSSEMLGWQVSLAAASPAALPPGSAGITVTVTGDQYAAPWSNMATWTPRDSPSDFKDESYAVHAVMSMGADDGTSVHDVMFGAVPSWLPDPVTLLISPEGWPSADGIVHHTVELPTFRAPTADGRLMFLVGALGEAAQRLSGSDGSSAPILVFVGSDGSEYSPSCMPAPADLARCATLMALPIQQWVGETPLTTFATPTLSLGTPPATPAPGPAQLAVGVEAARGLSSRAGDLAAVDATVTGEYYLAGDLGGASVRLGVIATGAAPQITVFAVSTAGTTVSPTAPLTWAPVTATIPESWARFPDDKVHTFTTGITPAGAPRVFFVATWGFDLPDGSQVHALEVPTFAPPAAVAAALAPDQRMWLVSDSGAPQSVGSGWSGYVYASSDGTIVDPSCTGASASQDSCARSDLDFGAYAEIRAALTK